MKFLKCAVVPALCGMASALLFLLLSALILQKTEDPANVIPILSQVINILCAGLCGLVSAVFAGERRIEYPLYAGLLMMFFYLLLSLFPGGTSKGVLMTTILLLALPAVSFMVGALVMNGGKNNAKKMRKMAKRRYRGRM